MSFFSKLRKIFLAALPLLLFANVLCAEEVFEFFESAARINRDSSIEVTERITARVENIEIKRGIIRSFPVRYEDARGNKVSVGFDVVKVTLDGASVPWQLSDNGRFKDLRIGEANKIIPRGIHVFEITYRTTRQIGFFEEFDELYWNVTGNDWTFPIRKAAFRLALPGEPFGRGFRSVEWYVGRYGEKDTNAALLKTANTIVTTRTLMPGEGLTVAFTWPKGLVEPPPPPKTDATGPMAAIGGAVLSAVTGWFIYAWRKWGKDPTRKAAIPIFYPPEGASPAFLRYVRDLNFDRTAFTAAVIGLAVKGALTIEEEEGIKTFFGRSGGGYVLVKNDEQPSNLETEEAALMKQLFPGSKERTKVSRENGTRITSAINSLARHMRLRRPEIFTLNTSKCFPAILIYAAGTLALLPFSGERPTTLTFVAVCGAILSLIGMRRPSASNSGFSDTKQFIGRIFPPAVIAAVGTIALSGGGISPIPPLLFIAATAVISVMRPLLAARTQKGSDLLSDAEGLAMYMETAEKGRLEMFNAPEETPELFERLLPYALALDTAKTWANRFEKILAAAQYSPQWYDGPSPHIFMSRGGLNSFALGLENQFRTSTAPTPSSAPGSSMGSGGGGFSGGGGGGGGGRGW